ncbi:MAG: hypothetical protein ACE14L_05455 [Terriglobales bacterium]
MRVRVFPLMLAFAMALSAQSPETGELGFRTTFRIRYVADGAVYVEGGREAGLSEGMHLVVKAQTASAENNAAGPVDAEGAVAHLKVVAVAAMSAVCEIVTSTRPLAAGDVATLHQSDVQKLVEKRTLGSTRSYPAVVSFTESDPLDEEVRAYVPRPPLPEVNRAQGRIGFDFSHIGAGQASASQFGMVIRANITRINGTYWNLSGYWRGRLDSRSSPSRSIQDLINRTYHLNLTYSNPNSAWVAGFGRMYLPWASSLETIDGGYFGRKLNSATTAGIFAGSTPDPSSWSYDPNRRIGGTFVNVEGGTFDELKHSSTFGLGVSMMRFRIDRPFIFAENDISFKRVFSLYHALQIDSPRTDPAQPKVGTGLSRSYLTLRYQPTERVTLDLNHTYFRDVPTYDPQLIGTGLLDKYLFQGVSGGVRVQMMKPLTVYTNVGHSSTSRDSKGSWNTMFGATTREIWRTGLRADLRYSKFDSAFARGTYRSLSLTRNFGEGLRWEVQAGTQQYTSAFSQDSGSRFVTSLADVNVGTHYFFEAGLTVQRGAGQRYNQIFTTFGYRFDNRARRKEAMSASKN